MSLLWCEHEVEGRFAVAGLGQQQFGTEVGVGGVGRVIGEEELGCQHCAAGGLNLDVEVARAAVGRAGDDGLQPEAAVGVGELVAAQPEAAGVIDAIGIGLPEVEPRAGNGGAVGVEDVAGDEQRVAGHAHFAQRRALRCVGQVVGAFGRGRGQPVADRGGQRAGRGFGRRRARRDGRVAVGAAGVLARGGEGQGERGRGGHLRAGRGRGGDGCGGRVWRRGGVGGGVAAAGGQQHYK